MPEATPLAEVRGFAGPGGLRDFDVHRGDVLVLRGANGCGKTSLLRLLAGLPSPIQALSVRVAGRHPAGMPARDLARLVHVAMQDPRDGMVGLTVAGEFRLRGHGLPMELAPLADREVATLSSGEARRVALSVAEAGTPSLLLLDEPSEGLDDERRSRLAALVRRQQVRGAVVACDPSGLLDGLATRRIDLQPSDGAAMRAMPEVAGPPILAIPAETVQRGNGAAGEVGARTVLALPALVLGPGLHALAGPNGSGKSTMLLRAAGLLGKTLTRIDGKPPVPGHNVSVLLPHAGEAFFEESVAAELADTDPEITSRLVASELLPRHPLAISGGQAQRVALAKAFGRATPVYLLDEPEAHLDRQGRAELAAILAQRIRDGCCILAATHDEELLAAATTRTLLGGPA